MQKMKEKKFYCHYFFFLTAATIVGEFCFSLHGASCCLEMSFGV